MMRTLLIIIFISITVQSKADMWTDPTWKEMLDTSEVIALVQYTTKGDFRAEAKVLTVYKGNLKTGDMIWISGFSNRYGPIDKMNKGDRYLVFLTLYAPDNKGIASYDKELKTRPELKDYVAAYKNSKAYGVWSATAGDLKVKDKTLQYDLSSTTYHSEQPYYPLKDFERFLTAYHNKAQSPAYCKEQLHHLKQVTENGNTQALQKLYLLGYDQYDPVFESYIQVNNFAAKFALAQLMGNIKGEEARKILLALLNDNNSLVQGEAVRQLKNAPAEIIGPILLQHLQTSAAGNYGPSSIMAPVRNTINGGKTEIINTLAEIKYKPAIPELLSLLETDNEDQFMLVIEALKKMESKAYIPYIIKHLDKKTDNHFLMSGISKMIARDSLTECLPAFKHFISTCDRNALNTYDYTVSSYAGIGHFKDSATISFLLSDFERFYSYKDTLPSDQQKKWISEYIETFADLKVKEARPLIYRALHDWFGLNEDFGKQPRLFAIKRELEDSFKTSFANGPGKKGYKLDTCLAFIDNTTEVINGEKPKVKYLIEVMLPLDPGPGCDVQQEKLAKEINLPPANVYVRFTDGSYCITHQERFNNMITHSLIDEFLNYFKAVPDKQGLDLLQALSDSNFNRDKYYTDKIKETIETIRSALK
jgi:hypothetical protein